MNEDWTHDKFDADGAEPKPVVAKPSKPAAPRREEGSKVTIQNLKYDVTEDDLKVHMLQSHTASNVPVLMKVLHRSQELFEQYGSVLSAKIRFEKDGRSTGNAYVIMRTRIDARKAVDELNGKCVVLVSPAWFQDSA